MLRIKLLCNPSAGRGRAARRAQAAAEVLRQLGADVDLQATASGEHLTRLSADASRGACDRVVVCGGDGSVSLAVRRFDLDHGTLGIIPSGSGNDFASVCGIPTTLRESCEAVVRGQVREVDVALANGVRYLGVAGLGFDAEVNRYANEEVRHLRGPLVYLYAIFRVLPKFEPLPIEMQNGSKLRREQIMFAAIGNTRQYGGGIRIVPDARPDDGLLDFCLVHRTSRLQLLRTLPLAYTGGHVRRPFVETGRGREFRFESERALDVYADGERITRTPVAFTLEAKRLKVVVPVSR